MHATTVAIDLAKNAFRSVIDDAKPRTVERLKAIPPPSINIHTSEAVQKAVQTPSTAPSRTPTIRKIPTRERGLSRQRRHTATCMLPA
jgi:hypothetical protein